MNVNDPASISPCARAEEFADRLSIRLPILLNLWIPGAPPVRDLESEARRREFLAMWGPPVPLEAGDAALPDFDAQCQALLSVGPKVISSIMGLYPPAFVSELKARRIFWFATVTTVSEAKAAEEAVRTPLLHKAMRRADIAAASNQTRRSDEW